MRSSPGVLTLILLYITLAEVSAIFIDADTNIKGVQLGEHEIKKQILVMMPPFFLRNIIKRYHLPYQKTSDFKTM